MVRPALYERINEAAMAKYLDRFKLTGKLAVVTGGAQGIGLACVEALAEAGGASRHRRSGVPGVSSKPKTPWRNSGFQ